MYSKNVARFLCFLSVVLFFVDVYGQGAQLREENIDYTSTTDDKSNLLKQTTWIAQVIRIKSSDNVIPDLIFEQERSPVFLVRDTHKFRPLVQLKGVIKNYVKGSQLVLENKYNIPVNEKSGYFQFSVYLTSKKNEVNLILRRGDQFRTEKLFLVAPEAEEYNVISPWDSIRISLGTTYFYYNQTGYSPFYSWVGQFALRYHSPERKGYFGFSTDLDLGVVTFKSNQNNFAPQVGQVRFELIYFDERKDDPQQKIHYFLGGTYLTMLSNGAAFGFKNLIAPDIGIRLRQITSEQSDWAATFRLALMDTQLKDRGVEIELTSGFIFKNSHRGELGVRYLDYMYSPDKNKDQVSLKMTTLFLSYTL